MNQLAALLRDFAQGASNNAASTVTAPVDALAWLLRKGGVPIPENPVGGSDWARQKGLTAEPQNKLAGLLGDAAGMAVPLAAFQDAPKIARGLLQMEDNLAAPSLLNKQSGVIGFPENTSRAVRSDSIKQMADDLAAQLNNKGFQATVDHSGSVVGPSSYVKIFDPETGRFIIDPARLSDHAKGPLQSQRVHEIWGDASSPDFSQILKMADDMRAMGPSKMKLMELEKARNGKPLP
jgi:hypothetical protein